MIKIKEVNTDQDFQTCLMIRHKVFCKEQNVPIELELDKYEKESIHFLAFFDQKPAATGRLRIVNSSVKFERIATLNEFRGKGVATKMMGHMERYAKEIFPSFQMTLDAQTTALTFYLKLGWTPIGECFYEANIEHQKMIFQKPSS